MEQIEFFGFNSINNLKDILQENNLKKIFLVTGRNSYGLSGAKEKIPKILDKTESTQIGRAHV